MTFIFKAILNRRMAAAVAVILLVSGNAAAQKGNIGYVYPSGARKGTEVELTVGGQGLGKVKGILFSGEGVSGELIKAPTSTGKKKKGKKDIGEEDNLQLADKAVFRVTVDRNASSGIRDVRLVFANGYSNRLYFEVGELPDVMESPKEALSGISTALPVTFNGQVTNRDVDRFRFSARKGQQLVLSVKARVLVPYIADAVPGWFQPIIRLYDPSGKEVAFNDDYTFHVDPVLFYKVPSDGEYEVEINDALYRGREDFVYRIDVGELPFISSISPLGAKVGKKCKVALRGYNLPAGYVNIRSSKPGTCPVRVKGRNGISSNTLGFDFSDSWPVVAGKKPLNLTRELAWEMSEGDVCERVFTAAMQQHWYVMTVDKRCQMHMEVRARCLGAPTDARITVYSADGSVVKDVDDFENLDDYMTTHYADPQLTASFKSGRYYIRIIESQGHYGEEFAYRFCVDRASPDFSLYLEPANFSVPANGTGVFSVVLNRKQNFRGEVDLRLSGLPSGFKYSSVPLGQGQKKTFVSVSAPSSALPQLVRPKVTGVAVSKDIEISRDAVPVETMMQAFYYTHYMPVDEFRMEVGEEQPFRVIVENGSREVLRLNHKTDVVLNVRIERKSGFTSPVTLMARSSISGVKAEAVVIPGDESNAQLHLTVKSGRKNKKDIQGALSVYAVVKGSSRKIKGKARNAYVASVTAYAPVIPICLPAARQ